MALGGGTFTTQNKVLPGSYINFVSASRASANLSDRGYATMPLELDWGVANEVFTVTQEDFQKNSRKLYGYDYTHAKLKGLRDLFKNIQVLYAYRLNGGGVKASNTYATALYAGTRGNSLSVKISANVDVPSMFDVTLLLDMVVVDKQTVASAANLLNNDYVTWKTGATLAATAGTALTGGTNATVSGVDHQAYLDKIESYAFNAMGVVVTDNTTKQLYASYCKRLRDNIGSKFQLIVQGHAADYEGVINVKNTVSDANESVASLVYWVTGLQAGCAINKSCLNKKYDGEFTVVANYTQMQLENAIKAGEFTLHKVGTDIRVLSDINSLVTETSEKNQIFKDNQTIRVVDQIATDIATLFNTKYLGVVPNDADGRISLWTDIVKHHQELQNIRAIENFSEDDVVVALGDTKKSVVVTDSITVVNAMSQLYMTVKVA